MKISIDKELCAGHGRCYVLSPELITDDDDGYSLVVGDGNVAADQAAAARRAAAACPERAVTITE